MVKNGEGKSSVMEKYNLCKFYDPPRDVDIEVCKWHLEWKDPICLKRDKTSTRLICEIAVSLKGGQHRTSSRWV